MCKNRGMIRHKRRFSNIRECREILRSCNLNFLLGLRYPFIECVANGMEEPGKLCPAEKKPDLKKIDPVPCNPHECNPYSWVKAKGVCSVSCGNGKCCNDMCILLIDLYTVYSV